MVQLDLFVPYAAFFDPLNAVKLKIVQGCSIGDLNLANILNNN